MAKKLPDLRFYQQLQIWARRKSQKKLALQETKIFSPVFERNWRKNQNKQRSLQLFRSQKDRLDLKKLLRKNRVRRFRQFREQVRQEDLLEKTEEEKATRICRSIQVILSERTHQKALFFLLHQFTPLIDQEVEDNRFLQERISLDRIRSLLLVLVEKDLHTSQGRIL